MENNIYTGDIYYVERIWIARRSSMGIGLNSVQCIYGRSRLISIIWSYIKMNLIWCPSHHICDSMLKTIIDHRHKINFFHIVISYMRCRYLSFLIKRVYIYVCVCARIIQEFYRGLEENSLNIFYVIETFSSLYLC